MSTDYGTATLGVSDIPLISIRSSDPYLVIGQRIARRLTTPRGGLAAIGDDPNFGWDVRQYTNGRLSPVLLAQAKSQIEAECTKDEEISAAFATLTFANGGALTITLQLTSAAGPFTLVMPVANLSATLIFGGF